MSTDDRPSPPVERARWRAMGSDVEVIVVDGPATALDRARRRIEQLEQRWSRFLLGGEISRLNHSAGEPVQVSADTVLLIRTAIDAWYESGGAVNPTVLGAVLRAGYDTTFDAMAADRSSAPPSPLVLAECTDIEVNDRSVTLPHRTGFDPGGVGKGLAADMVVTELRRQGAAGACVNIGGDLRVSGSGPSGHGWTIAVESADNGPNIVDLGLLDGAVATSTISRRRWRIGGEDRRHLIDRQTGAPSSTDLVQATAVTAECWLAETYAKTMLLRGRDRSFDVLPPGVAGMVVAADLGVIVTDSLWAHVGPDRHRLRQAVTA